ncbi:Uncharacterised protein [Weissella viridescens]|uniref:Uncharacterized protein n=1 Tax=Weissella viridescens TaxID=1629 RepID=A0A380NYJ5_WEIVI|nr:Uncharacterised protein [Weissella viridescens]
MCQLKHYLEGNGDLSAVKLDITGTPFKKPSGTCYVAFLLEVLSRIRILQISLAARVQLKLWVMQWGKSSSDCCAMSSCGLKSKQGSGYRGGMLMKEWLIAHEQNVAK